MNLRETLRTSTLVLAALVVPATASASEWAIDKDHSQVGFSVRHLMVSNVTGKFKDFEGAIVVDDADVTKSKVDVTIKVASVDTANDKRDEHLRNADFFDVSKFPEMKFQSTKVTKKGAGLEVQGNLTLHGVTKPVVLDVVELTNTVKDPWGNTKRGAVAKTSINRADFGLTWNKALETGGVVVGEKVDITLELELIQKAPKKA